MDTHPPDETLRRFSAGRLKPTEMASVAIHVARCEQCRAQADREAERSRGSRSSGQYGSVIRRVARTAQKRSARFDRQMRRAAHDLDHLLTLPEHDWDRVVRSSGRLHSYAFARTALDACREGWTDDPYLSERLAEVGLFVAERLPNAQHGRRNLNDLRAEAWACIGNCRRIRSNVHAVPEAFEASIELLRSGHQLEEARTELLSFMTSLSFRLGQFQAAHKLLEELREALDYVNDRHEAGRYLMKKANILGEEGQSEEAIDTYRRAKRLIVQSKQPELTAGIEIGVACELNELSRCTEALAMLDSMHPESKARLGRLDAIRFAWNRARILRSAGRLEASGRAMSECREEFRRARIPYEMALLDLELAQVHLDLGKAEDARVAAREAFPIVALRGIEHRTVQAIDLFRKAGGLD